MADVKHRIAIAIEPNKIHKSRDQKLSTNGATVNLKIQGRLKSRLKPILDKEKLCFRRSNGSSFT